MGLFSNKKSRGSIVGNYNTIQSQPAAKTPNNTHIQQEFDTFGGKQIQGDLLKAQRTNSKDYSKTITTTTVTTTEYYDKKTGTVKKKSTTRTSSITNDRPKTSSGANKQYRYVPTSKGLQLMEVDVNEENEKLKSSQARKQSSMVRRSDSNISLRSHLQNHKQQQVDQPARQFSNLSYNRSNSIQSRQTQAQYERTYSGLAAAKVVAEAHHVESPNVKSPKKRQSMVDMKSSTSAAYSNSRIKMNHSFIKEESPSQLVRDGTTSPVNKKTIKRAPSVRKGLTVNQTKKEVKKPISTIIEKPPTVNHPKTNIKITPMKVALKPSMDNLNKSNAKLPTSNKEPKKIDNFKEDKEFLKFQESAEKSLESKVKNTKSAAISAPSNTFNEKASKPGSPFEHTLVNKRVEQIEFTQDDKVASAVPVVENKESISAKTEAVVNEIKSAVESTLPEKSHEEVSVLDSQEAPVLDSQKVLPVVENKEATSTTTENAVNEIKSAVVSTLTEKSHEEVPVLDIQEVVPAIGKKEDASTKTEAVGNDIKSAVVSTLTEKSHEEVPVLERQEVVPALDIINEVKAADLPTTDIKIPKEEEIVEPLDAVEKDNESENIFTEPPIIQLSSSQEDLQINSPSRIGLKPAAESRESLYLDSYENIDFKPPNAVFAEESKSNNKPEPQNHDDNTYITPSKSKPLKSAIRTTSRYESKTSSSAKKPVTANGVGQSPAQDAYVKLATAENTRLNSQLQDANQRKSKIVRSPSKRMSLRVQQPKPSNIKNGSSMSQRMKPSPVPTATNGQYQYAHRERTKPNMNVQLEAPELTALERKSSFEKERGGNRLGFGNMSMREEADKMDFHDELHLDTHPDAFLHNFKSRFVDSDDEFEIPPVAVSTTKHVTSMRQGPNVKSSAHPSLMNDEKEKKKNSFGGKLKKLFKKKK